MLHLSSFILLASIAYVQGTQLDKLEDEIRNHPHMPVFHGMMYAFGSDDSCARRLSVYVTNLKRAKRFCNLEKRSYIPVKQAVVSMNAAKVPGSDYSVTGKDVYGKSHTFDSFQVKHECQVIASVENCPAGFLNDGMKGKFVLECHTGQVAQLTDPGSASVKGICVAPRLQEAYTIDPSLDKDPKLVAKVQINADGGGGKNCC